MQPTDKNKTNNLSCLKGIYIFNLPMSDSLIPEFFIEHLYASPIIWYTKLRCTEAFGSPISVTRLILNCLNVFLINRIKYWFRLPSILREGSLFHCSGKRAWKIPLTFLSDACGCYFSCIKGCMELFMPCWLHKPQLITLSVMAADTLHLPPLHVILNSLEGQWNAILCHNMCME